jgi:hypothetical protein
MRRKVGKPSVPLVDGTGFTCSGQQAIGRLTAPFTLTWPQATLPAFIRARLFLSAHGLSLRDHNLIEMEYVS